MKILPSALVLGASTLLIISRCEAVMLTFEFRGNPATSSVGVEFSPNLRSATQALPGQTVGLDLFAIINGIDADNTNDGFLLTHGSFLSSGADGSFSSSFSPGVGANNVEPFVGGVSQSGLLANLDFDPGLEVGSLATTGTLHPSPWFIATTDGAPVFGTAAGGGITGFQIGKTTYTLAAGVTGIATLNYAPRIKTDSLNEKQKLHRFTLDGVSFGLRGDSAEIASAPFLITAPEPSTCGMLMLGLIGLVKFRRLGLRSIDSTR